ncbi:MAG: Gldg family protein [Nitrospiraceae bacterium]|nr:MAG: Gldg family protein [Nitrospiraceae bacterium]
MGKKVNINTYSKFLIYVIIIVLINLAGITLFFRADLTSNKVYSLSDASKQVVKTLSEPLTVKVFFSSNLPAPYNNIDRYLHDLLEEYAVAGERYFNYQFHDVSGEESDQSRRNRELAQSYGVHPVQIQNIEQDEVKFQQAYMGIVLMHGDIIEALPSITSTDGLEYQITSAIQKMNNKISALLRLKDNIRVKLFLSSSLSIVGPYMNISGLSELPSNVKAIVNKLNGKNYGKLEFSHLNPSIHPDSANEAEQYNIVRLNWEQFQDRRGKTIPADSGYAGIIVEHGNNREKIKLIDVVRLPIFGTQYHLTELDALETAIDETIEKVININEEIGYLADHGTLSFGQAAPQMMAFQQEESLSSLSALLSDQYSVRQINLKEEGIPDGLSFLIIAGAKENFSEYELYQIDQFLMRGNKLAVFMDSFNQVTPQGQQAMQQMRQPVFLPLNTGLEKLLAHYGVTVKKSIVLDTNSYKQRVPSAFGGGERQIYFAPIIKNEMINKKTGYLSNIKGLVMLQASPLIIDEKKIEDNGLVATRLFSSSEKSWEMSERINLNPMFMSPPADDSEFSSIPLAYTIEGQFPSYFADKPIPEKDVAGTEETGTEETGQDTESKGIDMSAIEAEGTIIKKGNPSRIFVIGTSEILKDNVMDKEGASPNSQFIMNVVDYLNNRENIAVMRSKTQSFNPLRDIEPGAKTAIKTANIAGLPVLVIIAGLIIWFRRTSRKRFIQKLFS